MKRIITGAVGGLVLFAGLVGAASADGVVPIDCTNGRQYAQNHIVPNAHMQLLGHEHKPGSHKGFSACLGVHAED